MTIQEYVNGLLINGYDGAQVAEKLGISQAMVSSYKNHQYNPSLNVAKKLYKDEAVALHPFSEEGLKKEIEKESK